jgi:hypothetical protein
LDAGCRLLVLNAALPNPQDSPPAAPKLEINSAITPAIANDFFLPVPNVALGSFVAPGAAVPEAPIYEQGDLLPWPAKVWRSTYGELPAPAAKTLPS